MNFVPNLLLILAAAATGPGAIAQRAQIDPARISRHIRILVRSFRGARGGL
jgi:hypothetical protein